MIGMAGREPSGTRHAGAHLFLKNASVRFRGRNFAVKDFYPHLLSTGAEIRRRPNDKPLNVRFFYRARGLSSEEAFAAEVSRLLGQYRGRGRAWVLRRAQENLAGYEPKN